MPPQARQQGYLGPSCTIAQLLRNTHKSNLLVELIIEGLFEFNCCL